MPLAWGMLKARERGRVDRVAGGGVPFQAEIQFVGRAFDILGVAALVIGTLVAVRRYILAQVRPGGQDAYRELRGSLGQAILLGLEFLVAADIIRTVAVSPTLANVVVLGLIVLVRTFLSWALEVEIDGRWPWRRAGCSAPQDAPRRGQP